MTYRSVELSDAIITLYRAGLSRQEIRTTLQNLVSERYIREEIRDAREFDPFSEFEHLDAQKSLRRRSRGLAHNPKQYGEVYRAKAIGRGYNRLEDIGIIEREDAEKYWKRWRSEHPEGSP